jgi:glycolate oxidase subunit GlcD
MASSPRQPAQDSLIEDLREIVGVENVLSEPDELLVYECDGLPQHKHPPRAVVFPSSTEETAEVLEVLYDERVSFAPRGAGTGLSGGALAINRGVIIELARMRKILRVDPENRIAVVQTGLVNAQLSRAVFHHGLYYAPDPSSQPSCTIGGNIAENAGGIHCLKYGTTTDHVVGARVVLSDGKVVDLATGAPGYDLLGAFVGSEGTFGIATEATVRLTPIPQAIRTLLADFIDVDDASRAVSAIIAGGMLPAALEMMDQQIIRAVEASVFAAGLPTDAQAVLLVELDGIEAGIDEDAEKAEAILKEHGARSVRRAADESERKKLWAARKGAFGAVGRLSPDIMIQDAVVPRSRLPEVLAETYRISARHNLQLANVFHAGDGNLHPLICFDLRRGDDLERVRQAGREIMETCVRAGGSITGEHGVGLDKSGYLPLIFSEDDMNVMLQVRAAFDPAGLSNPGKIIPIPGGCGEARAVATVKATSPSQSMVAAPLTNRRGSGGKPDEKRTIFAARINDTRIKRELCVLVGADRVHRLSETSSNLAANEERGAERMLEVSSDSAEQTCEVMRFASRENLSVIPAGAGNWLDTGNALSRADLVLTARRMNSLTKHEPADLVATAEAGVTLRNFQKHVAQAGQWLPNDPPDEGNATLGGVVASGLAGPQNFGYGPVRSFVIGMRVALSDGRLIKAGGNVVKNVAGYDLCKLFTGSYGTLGLITELTFKLRPLPAEERTVMASGRLDSLVTAGRQIARQFFPVAVELISPRLAKAISPETKGDGYLLLVRFAGSSRAVISQTAQALKLLREGGHRRCETLDDDREIWRRLSAEPFHFLKDLSWRVQLRPTDLVSFVNEVSALETGEGERMSVSWHAGLGDGRLRGMARPGVNHQVALRALEQLREKAENLVGSLVVESAPPEIKHQFDAWGNFGSRAELMKRVKAQLDPENLLSPGRFFA